MPNSIWTLTWPTSPATAPDALLLPLTPCYCPCVPIHPQALSNSVWALAHIRAKLPVLDLFAGQGRTGSSSGSSGSSVLRFLESIATCAVILMRSLHIRPDLTQLQACLADVEGRFSCQAMVNIVWSYASMLGEECGRSGPIRNMFLTIRREAVIRCGGGGG